METSYDPTCTHDADAIVAGAAQVVALADLALMLRQLRRRQARVRRDRALTYRELAMRMECSPASVGYYLSGAVLPPIERFDELARLLGATAQEQAALAAARDRVAEQQVGAPPTEALRAAATDPDAQSQTPRTLPAPPVGFVGRAHQLSELDDAPPQPGPMVVSAVAGMAGVGKTALALHWAYQRLDRFPDGQLYVNLRGFDPAEPMTATAALQLLLGMLGLPPAEAPRELDERADRYRALLAGRRMLILLDNAATAAQVRPLLAPAPCQVVITSRDGLEELVAQGARRVRLDVLGDDEAVDLIRELVGPRCDRELPAVRSLIDLCGRLPLALRVAAELAASRPHTTLAAIVDELATQATELDAFATGDVRSDVRAVFSWSLRTVPSPAARAFALLGLAPAAGVDAYGLAALAAVPLAEAAQLLAALARAHLLLPVTVGRYTMHDLLRAYAVERAEEQFDAPTTELARRRLLDYYLAAASDAIKTQFPYSRTNRRHLHPEPVGQVAVPDLSLVDDAATWLVTEREAVVRLALDAAGYGLPDHAVALALVLRAFLDNGYDHDALAVHSAAFAVVRAGVREADRASVQACLGIANLRLGRLEEAAEHLERAYAGHRAAGDHEGAVMSTAALGVVRDTQGRYRQARDCQLRGLDIARMAGQQLQEAAQLSNVGLTHLRLEEFGHAADLYGQSLDLLAELGGPEPPAMLHEGLARALEGLGRHDEAMEHALVSLDIADAYGDLDCRLQALDALASINRRMGRFAEAVESLEPAVAALRDNGRRATVAQALNTLGEVYGDAGSPTLALERHTDALTLARRVGDRLQSARALLGIGDAYAALGVAADARAHWRQAGEAYALMRLPAADRVRERLHAVPA